MKNNKLIGIIFSLTAIFLANVQHATAQETVSDKYVATQWGMEDGLPQSSVNDIIQTQYGYIWLATFGGLVRFNGNSFAVFDKSNVNGPHSDRISRLHKARNGDIWCSTENGFLRLKNEVFTPYTVGNSGYAPSMVSEDSSGVIWVTVEAQVFRFENEKFSPVTVIKNSSLAQQALQNTTGAWLVQRKEILRTLGDSIIQIMDLSKVVKTDLHSIIEYPKRSGEYWIATRGEGVLRIFKDGIVKKYSAEEGLSSRYVHQLYIDKENILWVACYNGLSKFSDGKFIHVTTINGTNDKEYNRIFEDKEKNIWVGTAASGLHRLRPAVMMTIDSRYGLTEEKMLSLTVRKNGTMLFGTNCGGVYEWKNGKAEYSTINKFLENLCVWSLFEDSQQRVWVGSRYLMRFDNIAAPGKLYNSANEFSGVDIFAITEDSRGMLWFGCDNGLFMFDGKKFTYYTSSDGLTGSSVRTIVEDKKGTLWIGTVNGLHRIENEKLYSVPLELANNDSTALLSNYVRAIHPDKEGGLWIGLYGGGILYMKSEDYERGKEKFYLVTTHRGLFDNIVSHIVEDENGFFWIGSNRGIFRVNKQELKSAALGISPRVVSDIFGKADGMKSVETNGGFQPSAIKDARGNIYFPTVSGVVKVEPQKVNRIQIIPPIIIEKIIQNENEISLDKKIIIPHDSANIEIHYAALSYINPEKIFFRYKLNGVDDNWKIVGGRRVAYYNNIPPGEHTFQVTASYNGNVWNEQAAELKIIVLPPYWMTWWFRFIVILFFFLVGPSLYYYRVTELQREKMQQAKFSEQLINSQEQERRRIASELHDGLGQQILVIKNRAELALQQVQSAEKTTEQLQEIMQSAVSSISDIRTISHDLRPVHLEQFGLTETITNLCEQLQRTSSIEWTYYVDNIDGLVPKEKEINFYRILQEGTNNIFKHSSAQQASVIVKRNNHTINALLWDNGKGFDVEQKQTLGGLGLTGIDERVRTLNGTIDIRSNLEDGTILRITIPIHHNG